MKSKVFFTRFNCQKTKDNKINKLHRLFDESDFIENLESNDKIAIKTHFGELGNTAHISPIFAREIVDMLKKEDVKVFLTDTNTLYHYHRTNSVDHIETATKHGFAYSVINAPVIIADGLNGNNEVEVEIDKEIFNKVKIAGDIYESDGLVVLSHVKGHALAGFGGAIKNLAMGCASRNGKKDQHKLITPFIAKIRCLACKDCEKFCPENAISVSSHAIIDKDKCIGCNDCIEICPTNAIKLNTMNSEEFSEALAEYAYGSVVNKKFNKVVYINFLTDITPDCDCNTYDDTRIVNDIGILLSYDPVAIDKASYDLINQQEGNHESILKDNHESGADKFKGLRKNIDSTLQLKKAENLRLGRQNYELIEIM